MSALAAEQRLLARLYTDAALRQRFFAEPERVGAEFKLQREAALGFAKSCEREVARFALSLQHKRMNEASKHIPLTTRALKRSFPRLFLSYAATPPPTATNKPRADAEGFAEFLDAEAVDGKLRPAWAAELAHYELTSRASGRTGRVQVQRFQHDIAGIARALLRSGRLPRINGRPSLVLRWHRASGGEPREWSFRLPWKR